MISTLFEIVIEFVLEFAIEFFAEILIEMGIGSIERVSEGRTLSPLVGAVSYGIFGIVLGAVSTYFLPGHLNVDVGVRFLSRLVSPIALGFSLVLISWIVRRRDLGQSFFSLNKFISGAVMSIGFSISRYFILEY